MNNKKQYTYRKLKKILEEDGYQQMKNNGSHQIFMKKGNPILVIPHHGKDVKKCYIREIRKKTGLQL